MAKKGGLNRGLETLLPDILGTAAASKRKVKNDKPVASSSSSKKTTSSAKQKTAATSNNGMLFWDVSKLTPSRFQPRRDIPEEELAPLAESIQSQGVIQPLVIRKVDRTHGEIIAGERRWRAAQMAGLTEVPVVVKDVPDEACMAIALIENVQRENLNPVDEAMAVERLVHEFDLTHTEIAKLLGKSRAVITNLLRLLTLPRDVRQMLEQKQLEIGHAKVLLGLPANSQAPAARTVIAKGLSVRETEAMVVRMLASTESSSSSAKKSEEDPDIKRLQVSLAEKLGGKINILHNRKGKGKITIFYNNLDELDGILAHIQ